MWMDYLDSLLVMSQPSNQIQTTTLTLLLLCHWIEASNLIWLLWLFCSILYYLQRYRSVVSQLCVCAHNKKCKLDSGCHIVSSVNSKDGEVLCCSQMNCSRNNNIRELETSLWWSLQCKVHNLSVNSCKLSQCNKTLIHLHCLQYYMASSLLSAVRHVHTHERLIHTPKSLEVM